MTSSQLILVEFKAAVAISNVSICGGRDNSAKPTEFATVEMRGYVSKTHPVSITVQFQSEVPAPFIGTIQAWRRTEAKPSAEYQSNVEVVLPLALLAPTLGLFGRWFTFESIHNSRTPPYTDAIVADVRRVYFHAEVDHQPFGWFFQRVLRRPRRPFWSW